MAKKSPKVATESYKGVRDFYPEDQFIERYIFEIMSRISESFGYEEYNASLLEPAELYRSKTSEEIVNEQTYTFTDRGDREVTLRPEMTPTVARMVAARQRELTFPLRWYSIPNVFRYERPQRGRLREHWQLNADIFGSSGSDAEAEIIALAHRIMTEFGAREGDFEIRVSDRAILEHVYDELKFSADVHRDVTRLLDRREKSKNFNKELTALVGADNAATLESSFKDVSSNTHLEELLSLLRAYGITNVVVDTSIVRGFDYYTGMVFEVYDTSTENSRSLFGGGRYDNLMDLFGSESLPAVGFGMGDVTARDFLDVHNLLPAYAPATELMLCPLSADVMTETIQLAQALRSADVTVAINYSGKRAGAQVAQADKLKIPFVIMVGEKEIESGRYTIKHLESGEETETTADRIADHLFTSAG
jgi:histidyl-tRNA synthetase